MLILILPAAGYRLTTNKLPVEARLSPELEQSQVEITPQTHMLNEESGGSKGEMEFFGGGYDIPTLVRSGGKQTRERYEFAFGVDAQIWEDNSPSLHVQPGKSIP